MAIYDEKADAFDIEGMEGLPGVPLVDVIDGEGNVCQTGYYVRHVNRTPHPFGDLLKPEDVEHLVINDIHSDWGLPRDLRAVRVHPPYTIRIHEEATHE